MIVSFRQVCAPRFTTPCEKRIEIDRAQYENKTKYDVKPFEWYDKAIHGKCYWTKNTKQNERQFEMKSVIEFTMDQLIGDTNFSRIKKRNMKFYDAEQGFSVHITDESTEILMGLPGSADFGGTIIRKKFNTNNKFVESELLHPKLWDDNTERRENAYFGFSVASGYFDGSKKSKLLYVAGAPRDLKNDGSNATVGRVYIFDIIEHRNDAKMKKHFTFYGEQLGEYFGYSVLVEDFDDDGFKDIAIGAPYRSSGAVYVYKNQKTDKLDFKLHCILNSTHEKYSKDEMFGASLMKVGDINQDGFNGNKPFELMRFQFNISF